VQSVQQQRTVTRTEKTKSGTALSKKTFVQTTSTSPEPAREKWVESAQSGATTRRGSVCRRKDSRYGSTDRKQLTVVGRSCRKRSPPPADRMRKDVSQAGRKCSISPNVKTTREKFPVVQTACRASLRTSATRNSTDGRRSGSPHARSCRVASSPKKTNVHKRSESPPATTDIGVVDGPQTNVHQNR